MTSTCLKRPGHQKIENTDSKPVIVPTLQVLLNQPDTDHPSTPIAMSTNPEAVATATVVTRAHAAREAQGTNQTDFNNRSSQNDLQSSIATIQQQLIELEIETTSLTERRDAASHGQLDPQHEHGGSLHTPPHQHPMHVSPKRRTASNVRSEKNLCDAFTKSLPEVTLLRLRSQLLKPRNF